MSETSKEEELVTNSREYVYSARQETKKEEKPMEQVEYKPTSALQWCVMKTREAILPLPRKSTSRDQTRSVNEPTSVETRKRSSFKLASC